MKKIDLHLHTQNCKSGDGDKRKINPSKFIEKMQENNIAICAITNHNKFDLKEYNEITSKKINFLIFPGIELDVKFSENEIKHIILVCSPERASDFKNIFSKEDDRNYDNYKLEYDDFIKKIKKFKNDEILIIPHFLDKDKVRAISIEEKDLLKNDLKGYVLILEPNLKTMGIINAHNEMSLVGSDVKDWGKYAEDAKKLPEIKFSIDSFGKFYELANSPNLFVKTVLKDCNKVKINFNNNTDSLEIYQDINVIFGDKGSGKTQLIKEYIYPKLSEMGKKVFMHEGKDYQKEYERILDKARNELKIDEVLKSEIVSNLDKILKFKEANKSNFIKQYIEYYDQQKKYTNAKKIKKIECLYNKNIEKKEDVYNEYQENASAIKKVCEINKKYRDDKNKNKEALFKELYILKQEIYNTLLKKIKDIFSFSKTDILIKNIKMIVEKKSGIKTRPNNIGFSKMVSERKLFFEDIKKIKKDLNEIESLEKTKIGELPIKGEIFINVEVKVLNKDEKYSKGSPFNKDRLLKNKEFIKNIVDFSAENLSKINKIFTSDDYQRNGEEWFKDCVKKTDKITNGNNVIYNPSEGEKSILSFSRLFDDTSFDYYLFDEIEIGLGNKYISEYIIPKLKHLRDSGKTIVLSTHNANIAINTLPTQTIYCNYLGDKNAEIYFAGNMYENKLVSIKEKNNIILWEDEAIKHLEGSERMFGVRKNIWN